MALARINKIKVESYSEDLIKMALTKTEEGNEYLQQANKIHPNGHLLVKALNSFEESIKIYSKSPEPYLGISWIFYISGDISKAVSFVLNALEYDSKNPLGLELMQKYNQNLKLSDISTPVQKEVNTFNFPKPKVNSITPKPVLPAYNAPKTVASKSFLSSIKTNLF